MHSFCIMFIRIIIVNNLNDQLCLIYLNLLFNHMCYITKHHVSPFHYVFNVQGDNYHLPSVNSILYLISSIVEACDTIEEAQLFAFFKQQSSILNHIHLSKGYCYDKYPHCKQVETIAYHMGLQQLYHSSALV